MSGYRRPATAAKSRKPRVRAGPHGLASGRKLPRFTACRRTNTPARAAGPPWRPAAPAAKSVALLGAVELVDGVVEALQCGAVGGEVALLLRVARRTDRRLNLFQRGGLGGR